MVSTVDKKDIIMVTSRFKIYTYKIPYTCSVGERHLRAKLTHTICMHAAHSDRISENINQSVDLIGVGTKYLIMFYHDYVHAAWWVTLIVWTNFVTVSWCYRHALSQIVTLKMHLLIILCIDRLLINIWTTSKQPRPKHLDPKLAFTDWGL